MEVSSSLSWIVMFILLYSNAFECGNKTDVSSASFGCDENQLESKILSRRKRFLIFPDGSSVQIVFEIQNHGYMQVGDIVWFSETASIAWELPKDPEIFTMWKSDIRDMKAHRRGDILHHIYYLDEKGNLLDKVPYTKKFTVPVFGKRSVDNHLMTEEKDNNVDVKLLHEKQKRREYLGTTDLNKSNIEFHRTGRIGLYEKVEIYLKSLGWTGRQCVLKMLCQSGKEATFQGTFVEEILRAIFTLPPGQKFDKVPHQEYDAAHTSPEDCHELYPDCTQSDNGLPQQNF